MAKEKLFIEELKELEDTLQRLEENKIPGAKIERSKEEQREYAMLLEWLAD